MKKLPIITLSILLALVSLAFIARDIGCRYRSVRADVELTHTTSALARLISDYTLTYQTTGNWPSEGTYDEESTFTYKNSTSVNDTRIDSYETLSYRTVTIRLNPDGTIECRAESFK